MIIKTRTPTDESGLGLTGFAAPLPPLRRSRNVPGALLGVLLVVVCSLVVATFVSSSDHRTQVLAVAKPVAAGTAIKAGDLTAAAVAADHRVRAMSASLATSVVGRIAAVRLVPGSLLVNAELATGPPIPRGTTMVGLALKPGFLPASLAPADTVSILDTPTGASGVAGSVLVADATVSAVGPSPDGQLILVSVELPASDAPAVAEANAQGSISVVVAGR